MGEKNINVLAADILHQITSKTNSHVAALYIQQEDNRLHLEGSYALSERDTKRVLQIGEGVAGQAFHSRQQIVVQDIPNDETTISFATGNTRPRSIVAVPISRYNIPLGVLELGSTQEYTPLQLEFLSAVAGNVGIAFYSAQSRIKLQELLEETQAQSEELQSQHSELENINAELEAQSQKLLASEEELRVQQLNPAAVKLFHLTSADDILHESVARIVSPEPYQRAMVSAMNAVGVCRYLAEYQLYVEETILYDRQYHVVIAILRDVTERESMRMKDDQLRRQTVDTADRVIDKQMRVVQEIASLLGETTAETKLALSKLKDAMRHE